MAEILNKYRPLVTSDSYNTTYQKYSLARRFNTYFTLEYGILDSKNRKESQTKKQHTNFSFKKEKQKPKPRRKEKTKTYKKRKPKVTIQLQKVSTEIYILIKDSSVAYIKLKSFSGTFTKKVYKTF